MVREIDLSIGLEHYHAIKLTYLTYPNLNCSMKSLQHLPENFSTLPIHLSIAFPGTGGILQKQCVSKCSFVPVLKYVSAGHIHLAIIWHAVFHCLMYILLFPTLKT